MYLICKWHFLAGGALSSIENFKYFFWNYLIITSYSNGWKSNLYLVRSKYNIWHKNSNTEGQSMATFILSLAYIMPICFQLKCNVVYDRRVWWKTSPPNAYDHQIRMSISVKDPFGIFWNCYSWYPRETVFMGKRLMCKKYVVPTH